MHPDNELAFDTVGNAPTCYRNPGHRRDHHQHSDVRLTTSFQGFTQEQTRTMSLEAGYVSTDFIVAEPPSKVPPDPTGQRQLFFAKGTK